MRSAQHALDDVIKRGLDIAASSMALAALAAPLAAIGVAIKLDSPGPVFYRGARIGRYGKPFKLFKFRSMAEGGGGPSTTSEDDPRVTRVGRFLRRYKLDELPQFLNVLAGHMSLVGPRPQVGWVVEGFSDAERQVLQVRPGITDWASIKFHNEGEIVAASGIADPDEAYFKLIHPEKMRLQLEYVRRRNLRVDLRILFETATTLFRTRATATRPIDATVAAVESNGASSSATS